MKTKARIILRAAGLLCIAAAIALACFNFFDARRAGQSAERIQSALIDHITAARVLSTVDEPTPRLTESEPPTMTVENGSYIGVLELPRLGLSLPVAATWDYDSLRDAPCRYSGAPYDDNLVICAHNYSSHFGRISELYPGDEAIFTDVTGCSIRYVLAEAETLAPDAVGEMIGSGYALSLFTCNWQGTARVTLRFDRAAAPAGRI